MVEPYSTPLKNDGVRQLGLLSMVPNIWKNNKIKVMFQTTNQYSLLMLCMLTTYESGMHIQAPKCTYLPRVVFKTHVDISKSSKLIQFPIAAGYPLVILGNLLRWKIHQLWFDDLLQTSIDRGFPIALFDCI